MACSRGCCETQAAHYRAVTFSTPNAHTRQINGFEAGLAKDRPASKRMRDEGLQPKSVKGSAAIEARASSVFEVESGRILPERDAKRVDEASIVARQVTA